MAQSPSSPALSGPDPADEWRRLHPVTPLLRGWKIIAAALVGLGHQGVATINNLREGFGRTHDSRILLEAAAAGAVVLLVLAGWMVLSWRMTRYRVTGDAVEFRSGVLFRGQKQAKLDRLQAVDIVRPLLGRLVGLAELRIEVAGGLGSDFRLSYLTEDDADRLRRVLLAGAAGVEFADGVEPRDAPERTVFALGGDRLLASTLLSGATAAVLLYLAASGVWWVFEWRSGELDSVDLGAALGAVVPTLGVFATVWNVYTKRFDFRVAQSPDGIRLRHGLLEHRSQTLPPGRVQAVEIRQPLPYRWKGWWNVTVNVAGYGKHEGDDHETTASLLAPAVTFDELCRILPLVLPDLGHEDPVAVLRAGLTGTGRGPESAAFGFVSAPRAARVLDPAGWRRHGALTTATALLLRNGIIARSLILVPHARMQSVRVAQGPLQRRLGIASFVLHSTPGPVTARVDHLRREDVAHLVQEQVSRAAVGRASAGPEKWMLRDQ